MRFLPGNAQHIGSRHAQQDSFGFGDPDDVEFLAHGGFLAVVCDGMGGMEHGDAASRTAVRAFLDAYRAKTPQESIPVALERSVYEANRQVVSLARSLGMSEGIGTTLVAAALREHSLYFVSVGDSGLFLASGGELRMVNHPHIFANVLDAAVARGAMSLEVALAHPERESLTSFIGAESLEEIDRNLDPLPLAEGDTILLASDGMFKTLAHDEIAASLWGNPQSWPEALVERTLSKKREFQDNVTVLSVTLAAEVERALPRTVTRRQPEIPPAPAAPGSLLEPTAELPPSVVAAAVARRTSRKTPRSGVWIAIAILFLAAAGAGWWYARRVSVHAGQANPVSNPSIPASPSGDVKGPSQ